MMMLVLWIDIDECQSELHECNQLCENTIGSYSCSCNPGFELVDVFKCKGTHHFKMYYFINLLLYDHYRRTVCDDTFTVEYIIASITKGFALCKCIIMRNAESNERNRCFRHHIFASIISATIRNYILIYTPQFIISYIGILQHTVVEKAQ